MNGECLICLSGHSMCCSMDRIQDAIAPSAMWPDTPASTRVLLTNLVWISVSECAAHRVCCDCRVWHPSRHANPAVQQAVPAANSKDRPIEHVSVAAHRCCCIPCRSRKAPDSLVLRCQCSRCPLEQQPDRPVHGRLANVPCCLDPSDMHTVSAKTTQTRPSDYCAVVVDGQWSMPGQTASQRTCLPVCSLPSVRPPCWARLSDGHDHAALLDSLLHGLLHATLSSEPRSLP
ncbi:hypothetical protein BC831DRAFT_201143 [Entophlyctis helioformis]|nr:hypothetical protein BC831DRAFT_201143 [Entophlyctis helioformis]